MIAIYLGMGVALLATSAWVFFGFAYFRPRARWLDDDARKALYRDRLNEIETEVKSQVIENVDSTELTEELGVALLEDLEGQDDDGDDGSSRLVRLSLAFVVVAASVALYLHWGDPSAVSIRNVGSMVTNINSTRG